MKYLREYRDFKAARRYAQTIRRVTTHDWTIMEACGGQTHSIVRYGLDELLPKQKRYDLGAGDDDIFFLLDAQQRAANTESAFARSIVDYNLALLEISYESGQLLERYNIHLAEGPWTEDAYANAASRDLRFSQ